MSARRSHSTRGRDRNGGSRGEDRSERTDRAERTGGSGRTDRTGGSGRTDRTGGSDRSGRSRNREWVVLILFCLVAAVAVARLVDLQVIRAPELSKQIQDKRTSDLTLYARRGTIYDRNGNVLATSVDASTIYAITSEIEDPARTAQELADVLGGEVSHYQSLLEENEGFVYIQRKADLDKAQALQERARELYKEASAKNKDDSAVITTPLTGIGFQDDWKRYYPYGDVGAQVIGFVGVDDVGLSGLELQYDDILSGENGHMVIESGIGGTPVAGGTQLMETATDGVDIIISLDIELQSYLEAQMEDLGTSRNVEKGNAIVVDGETGEVYAAASLPLYSFSGDDYKEGSESLSCIVSAYEPGSIFKTLTAAAALENKVSTSGQEYQVPPELVIHEYTITDAHDRYSTETMTLKQIVEKSSNIGISMVEQEVGDRAFFDFIKACGVGEYTGIDYPGEANGFVKDVEDWSSMEAATISFGQSVAVTSLQMACLYGAIANDGTYLKPHFLISVNSDEGDLDEDTRKLVEDLQEQHVKGQEGTRILSTGTCSDLDDILAGVVSEGTGSWARIDGYTAAGKTGTGEITGSDGTYVPGYYTITFAGYLPNSGSALACAVAYTDPSNPEGESPSAQLYARVMRYAAERYVLSPG